MFNLFTSHQQQTGQIHDILLAHKVIESGVPNRFGARIPLITNWNLYNFAQLLRGYEDMEVIEWLKYGFSISRADEVGDPTPNIKNHLRAVLFPETLDEYVEKEVCLRATLGPFSISLFINRIGISPLSTRPKRDSNKRRVIMDLSFPPGRSVNDGIDKTHYCGVPITLMYPTVDTLARRIVELGNNVLIWKKDLVQAFCQIPLCPREFLLIGFRWRNLLYFNKVVPMELHSAAYICQRVTNAVVFMHRSYDFWSVNYLDDFGSAEKQEDAWASYNTFGKILTAIGLQEVVEKAVPPPQLGLNSLVTHLTLLK